MPKRRMAAIASYKKLGLVVSDLCLLIHEAVSGISRTLLGVLLYDRNILLRFSSVEFLGSGSADVGVVVSSEGVQDVCGCSWQCGD